MQLGAITGGVCELYRRDPAPLSVDELAQDRRRVSAAGRGWHRRPRAAPVEGLDAGWPDEHRPGRAQVYQAIGMLTVQLGVPAEEACARLRGHAYAHGSLVGEVADEIVARRLRLNPDPR